MQGTVLSGGLLNFFALFGEEQWEGKEETLLANSFRC